MNVVECESLGKFVYNENKRLHSYDGNPSIIYKTGATYYHDDGKLHRKGGLAMSYPDGTVRFYYKGYQIGELQHYIWTNQHFEPILPKTDESYFIGELKDSSHCF